MAHISDAKAQCAPDPVGPGGRVICAAADSDGLVTNADSIVVSVNANVTVSAQPPRLNVFGLDGVGSLLINGGTIDGSQLVAGNAVVAGTRVLFNVRNTGSIVTTNATAIAGRDDASGLGLVNTGAIRVTGNASALQFGGGFIDNRGQISVTGAGPLIRLNAVALPVDVVNTGSMSAAGDIINGSQLFERIVFGGNDASEAETNLNFTNLGTITGNVILGTGRDTFVTSNSATLTGNLDLGRGDDLLRVNLSDPLGPILSRVTGTVTPGLGYDVLLIDARQTRTIELPNLGFERRDVTTGVDTPTITLAGAGNALTGQFRLLGAGTYISTGSIARTIVTGDTDVRRIVVDLDRSRQDGQDIGSSPNFINRGTLSVTSGRAFSVEQSSRDQAVRLDNFTRFTNEATISATGSNAVGISISGDNRQNGGVATNAGSVVLTANSTGAFVNGGRLVNTGSITGVGDGIELRADTAPTPLFINSATGRVEVSGNAVLMRDDAVNVRNEGQLISTGTAAIFSVTDTGDRPLTVLIENTGSGLIKGNTGTAFSGAGSAERINNRGNARIEGNLLFREGSDRLSNDATVVGNVDMGADGDTVNQAGRIEGNVFTSTGNDYFQWLGGLITGGLDLGANDDTLDLGSRRSFDPLAIAAGGVTGGTQSRDVTRDTLSITSTTAETFTVFAPSAGFETFRIFLENSTGISAISNQAQPYTGSVLWIAGRGSIVNNLDITRAADFTADVNAGIYINTFAYEPDTGPAVIPGINVVNRGTIRAIGAATILNYGMLVELDTTTAFTGENAATIRAEGDGAAAVRLRGSTGNFSSNSIATFINSGLIEASDGGVGLTFARLTGGRNPTEPGSPGIFNTGTIAATGFGSVAVTTGNSVFFNRNLITANNGATGLEIFTNSEVTNSGIIRATDSVAVIYRQDRNAFVNSGSVISTTTPAFLGGSFDGGTGAISVRNSGLIEGNVTAFLGNSGTENIDNLGIGRIVGSIETAGGNDTVNNAGSITGNILLGAGNDAYANLGGTVSGSLDLGTGDDTLFLNRPSAVGSGIAGAIIAGPGASEIDRVQVLIAGTQTYDPRAGSVLGGFEILRIDGTRSGETLTLSDPGAAVATKVEVEALASNTTARATIINTANFATQNLAALEVVGGRALLANVDIGGTLINRGTIALDYTSAPGALRFDRAVGSRSFAVLGSAGTEIVNEATITASGAVSFVEFGDTKTQIAAAVGLGDTATELNGDRVVAPFLTNRAGASIIGINGARAVDTEGGSIIRNDGTIRATNVAGTSPAVMDLGNDDITNAGLIEGIGAATRAIFASGSLRLSNIATGTIRAQGPVIELDVSGARIQNAGLITSTGGRAAIFTDANSHVIANTGTISSSADNVQAALQFLQTFQTTNSRDRNFVFNEPTGRIEKLGGSLSILGLTDDGGSVDSGSGSAEVIINRGTINGAVSLGDGSDVFYASGGSLTGDLVTGRDGDVLILGDGTISGSADLGGGEDNVLVVAGTSGRTPVGGIAAGSGNDAFGPLFFASGSATLQTVAGFEMTAAAAIGFDTQVTLGAIGNELNASIRTLGGGSFINRHTVNATFNRAAIEVEDRDQRIVNEGTLNGRVGIDDADITLRLDNRGAINATQYGILAPGRGINIESETLGNVGRSIFNSGQITTFGADSAGIFNVTSGPDTVSRIGTNLGLTSVFAQPGTPTRDRPELRRSVLISNRGDISVTGARAVGIITNVPNAYVENLGTVLANGTAAVGIAYADADFDSQILNARIVNGGTIDVAGAGADGVLNRAERTEPENPTFLVNTGTIRTRGGALDRTSARTESGFIVDFATAVEMPLGAISNSATGVIEATDAYGIAVLSTTTRDEPGANGDDPGAPLRRGVSLTIQNDGVISGTAGYYAAYRVKVREDGDDRFVYENRFVGAIQGGDGTETIENRGTIRGAINLNADDDTVRNFGTIDGDVFLGVGQDTFRVGRGATSTGIVDGQIGFDLLELELAGDTSFDAARYTSFERLGLIGAGTLNLTAGTLAFDTIRLNGNGITVGAPARVIGTSGTAITGADGVDTVTVNGEVVGSIALGGGDDRFVRGAAAVVTGVIDGGAGRDVFEASLAGGVDLGGANNFEILNAAGPGTLTVSNALTFESVNLSEGNLDILASGSVAGGIVSGVADQTFTISGSLANSLDTGGGSDVVSVNGGVVAGAISLGDGDDRFSEIGAGVAGIVNAGAGRDTLSVTINGTETVDLARRTNFEILAKGGTGTLLVSNSLSLDGIALVDGSVAVASGATLSVLTGGISGGAGAQTVQNAGRIVGGVTLGDGSDLVDTIGVITGSVSLGSGDDVLRIGDNGVLDAVASGGAGSDQINIVGAQARTIDASRYADFETVAHDGSGVLTFAGNLSLVSAQLNGSIAVAQGATVSGVFTGGNAGIVATIRGTLGGPLTLGAGADQFVLAATGAFSAAVDAGADRDVLTIQLDGPRTFNGTAVSNFEQLDITGLGDLTLAGTNTFSATQLTGNGLVIANGATLLGSVSGSAGTERFTIATDGAVTGAIDLDGGDDLAVILGRIDSSFNLGAGNDSLAIDGGTLLAGPLLGGAGEDRLTLGVTGGSYVLSNVSGFELLDVQGISTLTGTAVFTNVLQNSRELTIAQDATLTGALTGSAIDNVLSVQGTFAGAVNLGAGNDTLAITSSSRLSGGQVSGGEGNDLLAINLTAATAPFALTANSIVSFERLEKSGAEELVLDGGGTFSEIRTTGALTLGGGDFNTAIIGSDAANQIIVNSNLSAPIITGASADTLVVRSTASGAITLGGGDDIITLNGAAQLNAALDAGAGNDVLRVDTADTIRVQAGFAQIERIEKTGIGTLAIGGSSVIDDVALSAGALQVIAGASLTVRGAIAGSEIDQQVIVDGALLGTIALGGGNDSLVLRGALTGAVDLGSGDDLAFRTLSGVLTGTVDGGTGTDNLILEVTQQGTGDASQFRNFEAISQRGGGEFRLSGNLTLDTITLMESIFTLTEGSTLRSTRQPAVQGMVTSETVNAFGVVTGNIDVAGGDDVVRIGAQGGITGLIDGGTGNDRIEIAIAGSRATSAINAVNFETAITDGGSLRIDSSISLPSLVLNGTGAEITASGRLTGSITGSDAAQSLDIAGSITGNAELGGGDDVVTFGGSRLGTLGANEGASVTGILSGGAGTDILRLTRSGLVTVAGQAVTGFETIMHEGSGSLALVGGTVAANVMLSGGLTIDGTVSDIATLTGTVSGNDAANDVAIGGNGRYSGALGLAAGNDSLTIGGIFTGPIDLGAGDDAVSVLRAGIYGGSFAGGSGTDTLLVTTSATTTFTGAVTDFETLSVGRDTLAVFNTNLTTGTIRLVDGGDLEVGAGGTLVLGETVTSSEVAGSQLTNLGTITGAISLGGEQDTIVNRGLINGLVNLGGGNDTFYQGLTGRQTQSVDGGAGDNNLIIEVLTQSIVDTANYRNFSSISQFGGGVFSVTGNLTLDTAEIADSIFRVNSDSSFTARNTVAVRGGAGVETVENNGQITGNIDLRDGNDVVVNNGRIAGDTLLGAGDDILTLATNGGVTGIIDGGAGSDRVNLVIAANRNNNDFTLANVETLGTTGGELLIARDVTVPSLALGGTGLTITEGATFTGVITGSDARQTVEIAGTLSGSGTLGGGDDSLVLRSISAVTGTVDGGAGTDAVRIAPASTAPYTFNGTRLTGFESATFTGGDVTLAGALTSATIIDNGDQASLFTIGNGATLNGSLAGNSAAQTVRVAGTVAAAVNLGGGADTLIVSGRLAGAAQLGDGNDTLQINPLTNLLQAVDGGAGTDTIDVSVDQGLAVTLAPQVNFEVLTTQGLGTVDVSGTQTYASATVGNAILQIGVGATLGATGGINGTGSAQTIINAGTLNGAVNLADGNDRFTIRNGSVNGPVSGGAGADTLEFNVTTAQSVGTLAGYTGFELLEKTGTGSLLLQNEASFGAATVREGNFQLGTGALLAAPQVNVLAGATLSGTGTITGNLNIQGILSPGASPGTVSVNGDVNFATGSTYAVELTAGGFDQLLVTGNVGIANGTTLNIVAPDFIDGNFDVIVGTGALSGTFTTVTASDFLLITPTYTPNRLRLEVLSQIARNVTLSDQARATINGFNTLLRAGAPDNVRTTARQLAALQRAGGGALDAALDQVHPEAYAASSLIGYRSALNAADIVGDLADGTVPTVETKSGLTGWAKFAGDYLRLDGNQGEGTSATRLSALGVIGGVGKRLGEALRVGIFVGQFKTTQKFGSLGAQNEADTTLVGANAEASAGGFDAQLSVNYSSSAVDTRRSIAALGATATSSSKVDAIGLAARVGYRIPVGSALEMRPMAALSYLDINRKGTREADAGTLNLSVAGRRQAILVGDVGIRLSGRGDAKFSPFAEAGLRTHLSGRGTSATAQFGDSAGSSFTVNGATLAATSFQGTVGARYRLTDALTLSGSYGATSGDGTTQHRFNVGLHLNF